MRALGMVIAIVLGIAGSSYIGPGQAARARAEFTTTLVSWRVFDIGPEGATLGDTSVRKWRITDRDGTAQGFGHEVCRWTSSVLRLCTGVYDLSTGSLVFEGLVGDGSALAVTGGTGEYFGASGEATRRGRLLMFVFD